ncbi:hypothetical protein LTR53_005436 [Teratosphaeriaceae sp. CCFEE 6253]|nr:hypothetical protein LTR53_005436 [Teratosphaeriaceae sp. CCFEE 6253]
MAWTSKSTSKATDVEMRVRPTSTTDSPPRPKQEDVAIEELGHKATIPRTLTSRLGIIGTISTVVCPWPAALTAASLALYNGGTGGLLIGFIVTSFFMTLVYYLLAEKLPLVPTAGGQYHMVLKLAPLKYRRFLSYICGFVLCFTWESYLTSAVWLFGMMISGIVTIWTGHYEVYYTFVPGVFIVCVATAVNLTWGRHMNTLEALVLVVQFAAFFLVIVLLAVASGTHTLEASFTFQSETGWSEWVGVAIAFSYATAVLGGFDCATHLAEDTANPREEIPKALLLSTTVNSLTCIVVAILVTFCAGDPNLFTGDLALSGHPLGAILQLFYDGARGNKNAACSVFGMCAIIFGVATINTTTTSSRMLFALIRDGRDPLVSKVFAKDLSEEGLPRVCIILGAVLPLVILWINFISSVGFQAIVSTTTLALVGTYFMVFACSLHSRIYRPELLGSARGGFLQPGKTLGSALDIISMIFLFINGLLCCLPFAPHPNAQGWNYAPFMVLAIILIGIAVWFISARKYYRPGQGMAAHHN